jgi:hypothetical protein
MPLLSPARAAQELSCPLWILDLLIDKGVLHTHRVEGLRKIRAIEVEGLRRRRDPFYRDGRYAEAA